MKNIVIYFICILFVVSSCAILGTFLGSCAKKSAQMIALKKIDTPISREKAILVYKEYKWPNGNFVGDGHLRIVASGDIIDVPIRYTVLHIVDTLKPNDTVYVYQWADGDPLFTWTNIR